MNVTWKDVKPSVISLLRDISPEEAQGTQRTPRYDDEDLRTWWNNGQRRLATLRPLQRHQLYRNDGLVVAVPSDFYRPVGVILPGATEYLPRIPLNQVYFQAGQPSYYIYEQKLHLTGIQNGQGEEFAFFYEAYFRDVERDSTVLNAPVWSHEACAFYVAMSAVTQEMMRDARYRKFISKNDAGNPQQNPFIPVAKWLRERFYEIVNTHTDDDEATL